MELYIWNFNSEIRIKSTLEFGFYPWKQVFEAERNSRVACFFGSNGSWLCIDQIMLMLIVAYKVGDLESSGFGSRCGKFRCTFCQRLILTAITIEFICGVLYPILGWSFISPSGIGFLGYRYTTEYGVISADIFWSVSSIHHKFVEWVICQSTGNICIEPNNSTWFNIFINYIGVGTCCQWQCGC